MIQHMTLEQIQDIVTGSCDFGGMESTDTWLEMIKRKSADSGMGHLIDSIIDNGFVETNAIPIINGRIQEGHHRLVAAILLCLDTVPVHLSWEDYDGEISINGFKERNDQYGDWLSAHQCFWDPKPIHVEV